MAELPTGLKTPSSEVLLSVCLSRSGCDVLFSLEQRCLSDVSCFSLVCLNSSRFSLLLE